MPSPVSMTSPTAPAVNVASPARLDARLALWASSLLVPAPLVLTWQLGFGQPLTQIPQATPVLLGIVAYAWWLLALALSARPRWLDRAVGLPAIYGFHAALGVLALAAAWLHTETTTATGLTKTTGDLSLYLAAALLAWAGIFLSGWLVDRVGAVRMLRTVCERAVSHRVSVWAHRAHLLVLALAAAHVHLFEWIYANLAFLVTFDALTLGACGIWAWHTWGKPRLCGEVTATRPLTETLAQVDIHLAQPPRDLRAGDFFFVRCEEISPEAHPFSLTAADADLLTFTIRARGDDTWAWQMVRPGARVWLEGPFGRFASLVEDADPDRPLILVGLGTGITPLVSLAHCYAADRDIHIVWIAHRAGDLAHSFGLDTLPVRLDARIGRLDAAGYRALLSERELAAGEAFIVGPASGVLATRSQLRRAGMARGRLHDERLTM